MVLLLLLWFRHVCQKLKKIKYAGHYVHRKGECDVKGQETMWVLVSETRLARHFPVFWNGRWE